MTRSQRIKSKLNHLTYQRFYTSPSLIYHSSYVNPTVTSMKALTLHSGQSTNFRRTSAVPQLTCQGKECRNYQPDVVQCTAVGEDGAGGLEWSCSAELPKGVRFGAVEVGCEGWEGPQDPYILRGSCGLTYELVRTSPALENGYYNPINHYAPKSIYDAFFSTALTAVTLFVLYRLFMGWYNRRTATNRGGAGGRTFGGWGGGGGGWWPGGGGGGGGGGGSGPGRGGPPPPYSAKPDPSTSTSGEGWRPGFWSGIAAGALGAAAMNLNRGGRSRYEEQRDFERYRDGGWDRGVGGSGSWGLGGGGGGGSLRYRDSSGGSNMGSMKTSTGFGGTRNR
ncbi:BQ2448_7823 [Microbotryum intermedium]|uniref:Store-operated calcium entry-associated regulatory factor n=1 Tax=Microbotryum intermedium TaxID=269621 RepID=A0A238FSG3_9BASI|nr:BQ2448_7823 [Microbotryum intermedium]